MSRPLSYQHVLDDHGRKAEQFTCVECGRKECVTNIGERPPDLIIKVIKNRGWKADAFKPLSHYCPQCSGPPKKPSLQLVKGTSIMAVTPIKPAAVVREATTAEREKIRDHLETNFDAPLGAYIDGFDDAKIAELVNVPRIIVERIREAAYGPIKVDPVVAGLRAEMAGLRRQIDDQQKSLDALKAKAADVTGRIEKLAAKAA